MAYPVSRLHMKISFSAILLCLWRDTILMCSQQMLQASRPIRRRKYLQGMNLSCPASFCYLGAMDTKSFDHFRDRSARLLRNELTHALGAALASRSPEPFRRRGRELLARIDNPEHQAFLRDRLTRYEQAFAEIMALGSAGPWEQALVLWNQHLFFEVHDILERIWLPAVGARRLALQAMIRAAGAYVHLEEGHTQAARRMAAKAAAALRAHGHTLPSSFGRERLLTALDHLDTEPPTLKIPAKAANSR
jgi:uncharacterized protein